MERLQRLTLAILLMVISAPAFAHGIEGVFQPLAIAGVALGLVSGVITGSIRAHPGGGLLGAFCVLTVGVLGYVVLEAAGSGSELAGVTVMMLVLVGFAGAIPLTVTYFVSFVVSSMIRERIRPQEGNGAP